MTQTIKSEKPEVIAAVKAVMDIQLEAQTKVQELQAKHAAELQQFQEKFTAKETEAIQQVKFISGITQMQRYSVDSRYIDHGVVFFVRRENGSGEIPQDSS